MRISSKMDEISVFLSALAESADAHDSIHSYSRHKCAHVVHNCEANDDRLL
jgi:effector-binding domain-containing protein